MAMSRNEHNWYGLISTYTTKLGQYLMYTGELIYAIIKESIIMRSWICMGENILLMIVG